MRNQSTLHTYKIPVVLALMAIAAILAFATVMTVSAQTDDRDWKQSPTGLNVTPGDATGELDLTWDATPRPARPCPTTASPGRRTARPSAQTSETEWYAYPTTNQVSVTGLDAGETYNGQGPCPYDDNKKSRWSDRRVRTSRHIDEHTSDRPTNHHRKCRGSEKRSPQRHRASPTTTASRTPYSATSGCAAPMAPITTSQTPPVPLT